MNRMASLGIYVSAAPPGQRRSDGSSSISPFSHSTPSVSSFSVSNRLAPKPIQPRPLCQLCLIMGHNEIVVGYQRQLQHAQKHLRQAAELLGTEETAALIGDQDIVTKCFPTYTSTSPPVLEDARSIPPILEPEIEESALGGTVHIREGKPLLQPVHNPKLNSTQIADRPQLQWESGIAVYETLSNNDLDVPGLQARASVATASSNDHCQFKHERTRRNKEIAVQNLLDMYKKDPSLPKNFQLVEGGTWPLVITDGYKFRLSRAYSSGKMELRCTVNVCKAKATIIADGKGPCYFSTNCISHCHEPVTKKDDESDQRDEMDEGKEGGIDQGGLEEEGEEEEMEDGGGVSSHTKANEKVVRKRGRPKKNAGKGKKRK